VLTELPFGNKAYVLKLNGKTLAAALEAGFAGAENEVGRFPQVAGMRVKADLTRPDGKRVVAIEIAGKPLNPARTYRLVTNDYLASGGDGYTPLKTGEIVVGEAEADLVANIVIAHIQAKGDVAPSLDGRITVIRARAPR
jgi:2',3'-cyclic-nucleotide 2'-phosphodiesterase (5'-nucleotidase family)